MRKAFRTAVVVILVHPSLIGIAHGATIDVSSCQASAVQSAINSAASGDTVSVPAGSCTWSDVTIPDNKKLTLKGAGKSATTITGMPSIGSSGSRITGFTFLNGTTNINGYGFRFDHNRVQSSQWTDCIKVRDYAATIAQMPYGLIDNNEFVNCRVNMEGTPYMYGDDNGTNQHRLWALPLDFGGPRTVYIEDNTFELTYSGNFNAIDANYGGSFVARYNVLYDGLFIETHSSQEGGNRSGKSFEVYGNIIDLRKNLSVSGGMAYRMRGGTGLVFMNEHVGSWSNPGIHLDNVRSYASGSGCGLCNGRSACDGNQSTSGWPCRDQIGRGPDNPRWSSSPSISAYAQPSVPSYFWINRNGTADFPPVVIDWSSNHIQADRDFYTSASPFTGASGVGCGKLTARPSTCTKGAAYWATEQSCSSLTGMVGVNPSTPISGTLYTCTSPNTWTVYYTPYTYPHPQTTGSATPLDSPKNLRIIQTP